MARLPGLGGGLIVNRYKREVIGFAFDRGVAQSSDEKVVSSYWGRGAKIGQVLFSYWSRCGAGSAWDQVMITRRQAAFYLRNRIPVRVQMVVIAGGAICRKRPFPLP